MARKRPTAPQGRSGPHPRRKRRAGEEAGREDGGYRKGLHHRWTVTEAAKLLAVDPKTVAMGLRREGVEVFRNADYSVRTMVAAVYGDGERERVRALQLDNAERERKAAREIGELVPKAEIGPEIVESLVAPLTAILDAMGAAIDTRCNPQKPELAREVIDTYVETVIKPAMRAKLGGAR